MTEHEIELLRASLSRGEEVSGRMAAKLLFLVNVIQSELDTCRGELSAAREELTRLSEPPRDRSWYDEWQHRRVI